MIPLFTICGAFVALILGYFLFGSRAAAWLEWEAEKMSNEAMLETGISKDFRRRGLHFEAEWHRENARILCRNVRGCRKVAGWIK